MSTVQRFYALMLSKRRAAIDDEERDLIDKALTAIRELFPEEIAKWNETEDT